MMTKFCNWIKTLCCFIGKPAKDKILHFLLGYIIFDYCLSCFDKFGFHWWLTFILSLLTVTIYIVSKELVDKKNYNGFDIFDLIAGYLGVLLKIIAFVILIV